MQAQATVGGNTDLKGAVIDSKADADKNKLSTDTITYSDIKNEAEWSAETKGVNYQKGDGVANKDKGLTPNFSGSKGEDDSTTQSAIAPGEIEIRSDEGKDEKDKTDLADLSHDPDKANNPLDKIFDKDKILEKQQAAALFGELAFEAAGKLAKEFGWDLGDPRRAILHGIIGGVMAEINGGKFGEGLTTAMINKIVVDQLVKLYNDGKINLTPEELRWISAGIGDLINGNQGSGIADSATKNNELSLPWAVPVVVDGVLIVEAFASGGIVTLIGANGEEIRLSVADAISKGYVDERYFKDLPGNISEITGDDGITRYWYGNVIVSLEEANWIIKQQEDKPSYRANPAHNPNSPDFNSNKDPEPSDAEKVYALALLAKEGVYYGKNAMGQVYRFFSDNAGGVHFSGFMTPDKYNQIPILIKRLLGIKG